jgi:putative transposase
MDKSTHQIRCEQWTRIINECLASGMSKTSWCKANGISDKAFFYWQRILRTEAYIDQKQLPAVASSKQESQIAFVELKPSVSSDADGTSFRPDVIIKKQDLTLEISNSISPELLKQLGGFLHAK